VASNFSIFHQVCKRFKRSVVCPFSVFWKEACRQFSAFQMVTHTIAAHSFSTAWLIGTVTSVKIFLFFTFHCISRILNGSNCFQAATELTWKHPFHNMKNLSKHRAAGSLNKIYFISTHRIPSGRHAGEITWLPFSSVSIRLAKVTVSSPYRLFTASMARTISAFLRSCGNKGNCAT
jgi:hypothetical protein